MWHRRSELDQEDLWKRYLLVNDWIKTADLKASFLAVASVGMIGFAINLNKDLHPVEVAFFIISLIFSMRVLWISLKVNLPILNKHSPGPSLLYYGNVASLAQKELLYESFENQDHEDRCLDLSNQIFENSKIAYNKMQSLGKTKWPLIISAVSITILASGFIDFLQSLPTYIQTLLK